MPLSLNVPVVSKSVSRAAIFKPRGLGVAPVCIVVGAVGVGAIGAAGAIGAVAAIGADGGDTAGIVSASAAVMT